VCTELTMALHPALLLLCFPDFGQGAGLWWLTCTPLGCHSVDVDPTRCVEGEEFTWIAALAWPQWFYLQVVRQLCSWRFKMNHSNFTSEVRSCTHSRVECYHSEWEGGRRRRYYGAACGSQSVVRGMQLLHPRTVCGY
jgi:hypothetical protein